MARFQKTLEDMRRKDLGAWKSIGEPRVVRFCRVDWPRPARGRFPFVCLVGDWIDVEAIAQDCARPHWRWPAVANDAVGEPAVMPPTTGRPKPWLMDAGYVDAHVAPLFRGTDRPPNHHLPRQHLSGHRDQLFDVASRFTNERSGPTHWPVHFTWSDSAQARFSDRSENRDKNLEGFSSRIWHQVRRRGGAAHPERESAAGPGTGGAKRASGADSPLPLPVNRRDSNPAWPGSVSPDPRNLVSLDQLAGLYGRGVLDPKSCIRTAWPYGPPPDAASPYVRLLSAVVDSFIASGVRPSTRPIEMEETYRAEHSEVEEFGDLLERSGLTEAFRGGGIAAVCARVGLTDRQTDVVLMSAGLQMSGRQIARTLGIRQPTVHEHADAAVRRCRAFAAGRTLSLLQVS